jgi:hypothetical protein
VVAGLRPALEVPPGIPPASALAAPRFIDSPGMLGDGTRVQIAPGCLVKVSLSRPPARALSRFLTFRLRRVTSFKFGRRAGWLRAKGSNERSCVLICVMLPCLVSCHLNIFICHGGGRCACRWTGASKAQSSSPSLPSASRLAPRSCQCKVYRARPGGGACIATCTRSRGAPRASSATTHTQRACASMTHSVMLQRPPARRIPSVERRVSRCAQGGGGGGENEGGGKSGEVGMGEGSWVWEGASCVLECLCCMSSAVSASLEHMNSVCRGKRAAQASKCV